VAVGPMAGRDQAQGGGSSGALASAVAGAVIGAAGLAWWLLSEAERRRGQARQRRNLSLSRLQGALDGGEGGNLNQPLQERELHQKVQELNQAIESVRRQLEQLQPQR
jgi:hypothetical protein